MPRFEVAHGHSRSGSRGRGTPTYISWLQMRVRCLSPQHEQYPNYGGRGIRVCDRWERFENFLADMGERPPGMTLDRKDNDGPYSPENCRWATPLQQQNNTRQTLHIEIGGVVCCLREWCRRFGIPKGTVNYRVRQMGWSYERALTTPALVRRTRRGALA